MAVTIENLTCPKCGDHIYNEEHVKKQLYVCAHPYDSFTTSSGTTITARCCHCQVYCKTCDAIFDQDDFGLHGDVYEHKECGTVNWPYTDWKRKQDEMRSFFRGYNEKANQMKKIADDMGLKW